MTVMDDDIGSGVGASQSEESPKAAGSASDQNSFLVQRFVGHWEDFTADWEVEFDLLDAPLRR